MKLKPPPASESMIAPENSRLPLRLCMLFCAVGMLLRLGWALAVPVVPFSDSAVYAQLAENLVEDNTYRWDSGELTAYWPVGTAFIYSLGYRVFGINNLAVILVNLLAGAAVLCLTARLAWLWFGARAAVVATALMALWPTHIQFTTILASEPFFIVAVLLAFLAWVSNGPAVWIRAIAAGLCLAGASYIRPTALLLPAICLLIVPIVPGRMLHKLLACALIPIVMAACIAPWSVRNTRAFGEFVLISTNGGVVNWLGNNPASRGVSMSMPQWAATITNEAQRDRLLGNEAKAYIRAEPLKFVTRSISKLIRTHSHESIGVAWNSRALESRVPPRAVSVLKLFSSAYWGGTLLLALGGVVIYLKQRRLAALLHPSILVWGYFAFIHAITLAQDRYHLPSTPMVAMLAALFWTWLCDRWHERRSIVPGPVATPS